jgi:purine-binding chemotaxis protein CheW
MTISGKSVGDQYPKHSVASNGRRDLTPNFTTANVTARKFCSARNDETPVRQEHRRSSRRSGEDGARFAGVVTDASPVSCASPALTSAASPAIAQLVATFYVDGLRFGIEVEKVQEIIRYQPMTRVPLASGVVSGLINLRGQIVTAIDLRARLQMSGRDVDRLPTNVVVRGDDGAVSLLVDEIGDVVAIDRESIEPTPATVNEITRALVRGIYKLNDELLLVLDSEHAIEVDGTDGTDGHRGPTGDGRRAGESREGGR